MAIKDVLNTLLKLPCELMLVINAKLNMLSQIWIEMFVFGAI